jgi:hypothetical protein
MKTQFRLINKGKGVLNISSTNLDKVEQPISELDQLYEYVNTQDGKVLANANANTAAEVKNINENLTVVNDNLNDLNENVNTIDNRVTELEYPDAVLKTGDILISSLNVSIEASKFAWRINQVEHLNPSNYSVTLDASTPDYIRYDLLIGTSTGAYAVKKGVEGLTSADIPTADVDTLSLAILSLRGDEIVEVIVFPVFDPTELENRLTELENKVTPVDFKTGLLGQAYVVWSGLGLLYYITYPNYLINSVEKQGGSGQITLDPTTFIPNGEQRFDLIYLTESGLTSITGTHDAEPLVPTINSNTEIALTSILLSAGELIPTTNGAIRKQVYDENQEWVVSKQGSVSINPDFTGLAFKGTKSIFVDRFGSNTERILFTSPNVESFSSYDTLTFRIYLASNANSSVDFRIYFKNLNLDITDEILMTNGRFDFAENKKDVWQLVNIPLNLFQLYNEKFTDLVLVRSSKDRNFYLDDIAFTKAATLLTTVPGTDRAIKTIITDDGVFNAETANAAVVLKSKSDGLNIKVQDKVIEFDSLFNSTLKEKYDDTYRTKTVDTLLSGKANYFTAIKPITSSPHNVLIEEVLNQLVYNGIDPLSLIIPNDATLDFPIGSVFYSVGTNTGIVSVTGGTGVVFQTAVGLSGVQNEVRKYTKRGVNTWGVEGGVSPTIATNPYVTIVFDAGISRTFNLVDFNKQVIFTGSNPVSLTLPTNIENPLPIGFKIKVTQQGSGVITSSATGISVISDCGYISTIGETRTYVKTDTNTWSIEGNKSRNNATFTGTTVLPSTTSIGSITAIIIGYLSGITSNIQAQLNAKLTSATGAVNYLQKVTGVNILGNTRLYDDGTNLGIDTVNPSKDISFGNQKNRELGVVNSISTQSGKSFTTTAGKTINFLENAGLIQLGDLLYNGTGFALAPNGDMYFGVYNDGIYVITSGTVEIIRIGTYGRYPIAVAVTINNTIYSIKHGGSTLFIGENQTTLGGLSNIFASRFSNKLYAYFNSNLQYTTDNALTWVIIQNIGSVVNSITEDSFGNLYTLSGGYLWKQTGGLGLFVNTNILLLGSKITCVPNGDIYTSNGTTLYKLVVNTTVYLTVQTLNISGTFWGFSSDNEGRLFLSSGYTNSFQPLYIINTDSVGAPNLDGGIRIDKAGTGKGTGKSWWQVWTGQKTVSGTDMQVETLRIQANEIGEVILPSTTVAIIDAETTGKQVVTKEWAFDKGLGVVSGAKTSFTYFVDSVNGVDLTGVYEDVSKPYKTIDYILALPNLPNDFIINMLTVSTYEINGNLPYKNIEFYSSLACTLSFANSTVIGQINTSVGNTTTTIKYNLKNGNILFTPNINGSANSTFFKYNAGNIEIYAKNVTVSNSFNIQWIGSFNAEIKNLNLTGSFIERMFSQVKNSVVNIENIYGIGDIRLNNTNFESITDFVFKNKSITTTGFFIMGAFTGTHSADIYYKNITTSATSQSTFSSGSVNVNFDNSVFDGKLYSIGSAVFSGIININNNTSSGIFGRNNSPTFKNLYCVVNSNGVLIGTALNSAVKMIDSHFEINNANTLFSYGSSGGADNYNFNPILKIFGNCTINHLTPNQKLYSFATKTATNLVVNIYGFLKTNALLSSDLNTEFTVINKNDNTFGLNSISEELKLSKFPNTRNDGANPTNKLLGTDASGNLKMYSMALMPAPFLLILVPDSTLPSTTTNFVLRGAFFTPTMTVSIVGQTINYITFVSDNEVKVNVTTGATEGSYAVTLNNGISATFNNALLIVLGTVYVPKNVNWINKTGTSDTNVDGEFKVAVKDTIGTGVIDPSFFTIPTSSFIVSFSYKRSPLDAAPTEAYNEYTLFQLIDSATNAVIYDFWFEQLNTNANGRTRLWARTQSGQSTIVIDLFTDGLNALETYSLSVKRLSSSLGVYINNTLIFTPTLQYTSTMKVKVSVRELDIVKIKLIIPQV